MTDDLRQRIEQVLREHVWYFVGNLGVPNMTDRRGYKCPCGWNTSDDDDELASPHGHVADVLLSVLQPDIDTAAKLAAITEHLKSASVNAGKQIQQARSYESGMAAEGRKRIIDRALAVLDGQADD